MAYRYPAAGAGMAGPYANTPPVPGMPQATGYMTAPGVTYAGTSPFAAPPMAGPSSRSPGGTRRSPGGTARPSPPRAAPPGAAAPPRASSPRARSGSPARERSSYMAEKAELPFSELHDYSQAAMYPNELIFKTVSTDKRQRQHNRYVLRRIPEAMTGTKKEFVYADTPAGRELTSQFPQAYGALGRTGARASSARRSVRKTPTLGGKRIMITNPNKPYRTRFGKPEQIPNQIAFGGNTFVRELPAIIGQRSTGVSQAEAVAKVNAVVAELARYHEGLAGQFLSDYNNRRFGMFVTNPITRRPLKVGSGTYFLILIGGKEYNNLVTDETIRAVAQGPVFAEGAGPKTGAQKPSAFYLANGNKYRVNVNGHAINVGGGSWNWWRRHAESAEQWAGLVAQARAIGAPQELIDHEMRASGPRTSVDAKGRPRSSRTSYGPLNNDY